MSETLEQAAPTPPTPVATPEPAAPAKAAQKPAGAKNGAAAIETPPVAETEPEPTVELASWPEDWRERIAKKDEQELSRLRRYASLDNYITRTKDIETRYRSGQLRPVLPENASQAEVAEYRKAHGIPAEPTPEGYGIKFPDGVTPNDADKADLGEFLTVMHGKNYPASFVQDVWAHYGSIQDKVQQQLHEAAQQATVNNRAMVRAEFGKEFDDNIKFGKAFIAQFLGGAEKKDELLDVTLADGTKLGDHPDFVRLYVAAALKMLDDGILVEGESSTTGGSWDEQYRALLAVADTDPRKYHSPEHQKKLEKFAAAKAARQNQRAA